MMFSGTISADIRDICVKYMENPVEIIVEDQSQLVLNGLDQYQKDLQENQKITELVKLLDVLDYSQVIIFVKKPERAQALAKELEKRNHKCAYIHGRLNQDDRNTAYADFKQTNYRILIATDVFQRGMDFSKVNLVINFDMPADREGYLHRVGRAGRQQTKGVAITFIASDEDKKLVAQVQSDLKFKIQDLPDSLAQ